MTKIINLHLGINTFLINFSFCNTPSGARRLTEEKITNGFQEEIKTKVTQKDIKEFIVMFDLKTRKKKKRPAL